MNQNWIIDGAWSEYHANVARSQGWALTQTNKMWRVVSTDPKKFATDDEAHQWVIVHEHDVQNILPRIALEAIVIGSLDG
jgi:hypothetical protein